MSRQRADFTSSLYLGMRHASTELPGWSALTTGRPAALGVPPVAEGVAKALAELQGTERALLARSTLHGFADSLEVLGDERTGIVLDAAAYPIARWAVRRAAGLGRPVLRIPHQDLGSLANALDRLHARGLRPLVVADGVCGGCGKPFPLSATVSRLPARNGVLLLDDTQALGLFGDRPGPGHPFGDGGGGSLRLAGTKGPVVLVSSLANAFGAPVATVAGPELLVDRIRKHGGSAMHASPPSTVDVAAAAHALRLNQTEGNAARERLASRVRQLRRACGEQGLPLSGGLFPAQATPPVTAAAGRRLLKRLATGGVDALLRRDCQGGTAVTLLVTASHTVTEVTEAATLLSTAWNEL
ncbi:aminotransferase class I/II-fold pyridoxal phosphate-dependent enzyme [Saccharothrix sp. AJ9571]|nr:aminotransferase class I/II-fold pyridoxal phosphate-dependent enzyme [Saccharothrix sp. AJ9571]